MPAASSAPQCPLCGVPFPADAVDGCCPRCLMAGAMQPTQPGDALPAEAPFSPEELAPHFPQLEILECLGRGGMGVVYKARQKTLGRLVALKLLAPERAGDARFAAWFEKEARALAALAHPHIVGVHDFGQAGGFYFLLMEFVEGVNLRQLLQTRRLTPREALGIVPQVCDALQCAHGSNVVHCDIKPENLLIDRAGTVKIADFGVARIVGEADETEVVVNSGTPGYAAPEQLGGNADHRTDIYSLGVVLYEMLTGERPGQNITPPSKRVRLDIRIDEIVLRALEKTPELRFATAADMRHSVEALVTGAAGKDPGTPPRHGRKGPLILYSSVLLALVAGTLVYHGLNEPKRVPPGAEWETFDLGHLSDAFSENVQFGRNPYGLTVHGLADTHGVVTAENMTSEGTLVYRRKSFNLSRLASLEMSCCFQRGEVGAGPQALALGLTGSLDGGLSGVPGSPFIDLRLKVAGDSLRLEFQGKKASLGPPRSWESSNEFITRVGAWYRLQVTFTPLDDQTIRVSGNVCEMDRHGNAGPKIGFFLPRNFGEPIFPVQEILSDHDVWVALRAHGPGGAALLDDLQILARPLPAAPPTQN